MKIITPFSTEILYSRDKLSEDTHTTIKEWILNLYSKSPVNDGNFYNTGFTTHFYNDFTSELHTLPEFYPLVNKILQNSSEYVANRISVLKCDLRCNEVQSDLRLKISKMWFNINPKHGYQARHHHAGFLLAGTYYVNVPKSMVGGSIEFTNPNAFAYYKNQEMSQRWLLNNYYSFMPETGDMLIWPGYLDHEIKTNKTDELRMTVSFCIDWEEPCPQ